jgi:hypothetical protein
MAVVSYLDEAVVEEEADGGGAHALLSGDGGFHHRLDGVVHTGARGGVEAGGQLRPRSAGRH